MGKEGKGSKQIDHSKGQEGGVRKKLGGSEKNFNADKSIENKENRR